MPRNRVLSFPATPKHNKKGGISNKHKGSSKPSLCVCMATTPTCLVSIAQPVLSQPLVDIQHPRSTTTRSSSRLISPSTSPSLVPGSRHTSFENPPPRLDPRKKRKSGQPRQHWPVLRAQHNASARDVDIYKKSLSYFQVHLGSIPDPASDLMATEGMRPGALRHFSRSELLSMPAAQRSSHIIAFANFATRSMMFRLGLSCQEGKRKDLLLAAETFAKAEVQDLKDDTEELYMLVIPPFIPMHMNQEYPVSLPLEETNRTQGHCGQAPYRPEYSNPSS